jgi:hypothetical protein
LIAQGRARDDVRLVYVNENYGDFSATSRDLADRALKGRQPDLVEPILPPGDCAFLTKVSIARSTPPRWSTSCDVNRSTP